MSTYAYRGTAPTTMTAAEQQQLLRATGETIATERDHLVLGFALGCGLREHEIAALDVADVVKTSPEVIGTKGEIRARVQLRTFKGDGRKGAAPAEWVAIPAELRRKLERYVRHLRAPRGRLLLTQPLLPSRKFSGRLTTRGLRHMFRALQEREGFERIYPFHVLRHTYVSNLYAATKDLLVAKVGARHRSFETTALYLHTSAEIQARAADKLAC